jgi:S-adenosylmethionine hydrolase
MTGNTIRYKKVNHPAIALLTDFGEDDFFVPSLKGVIASINPEATVIDITHTIPSFDILAGSFVLFAVYRYFPRKTVFVAVVDPGVGSSRKILLAESEKYFFIAPDNGILSLVLDEEKDFRIREVNNDEYFLGPTGVTFEGRDKMAPAAAWLSHGISPDELGPEINLYNKIPREKPRHTDDGIRGSILYQDKFGNMITDIPTSFLDTFILNRGKDSVRMLVGKEKIPWKENYSCGKKGEIFFLSGSLGLVEIAVREGSAYEKLKTSPGQKIELKLINEKYQE